MSEAFHNVAYEVNRIKQLVSQFEQPHPNVFMNHGASLTKDMSEALD